MHSALSTHLTGRC